MENKGTVEVGEVRGNEWHSQKLIKKEKSQRIMSKLFLFIYIYTREEKNMWVDMKQKNELLYLISREGQSYISWKNIDIRIGHDVQISWSVDHNLHTNKG